MPDMVEDELRAILDEEKQAILQGAYGALPELAGRKQAILSALAPEGLGPRAPEIVVSLKRNQTLLARAIEGIRAARAKVGVIRKQRDGFQTYDVTGRRNQIGGGQSVVERKY